MDGKAVLEPQVEEKSAELARGNSGAAQVREADLPATPVQVAVFVWAVWAALLSIALVYVDRFGSAVPRWEDWFHVPFLTGERPLTARWLWEQMAEHRVPLLKLLMLYDFRWFGLNVRPILFMNVALFGLLAAVLVHGLARVRGRAVYADAFVPIVLLNIGQGDGFLWAGTTVYVLTTIFVGVILWQLLTTSQLTKRSATVIGISMVLLTVCFGGGLLYALGLSIWVGGRAVAEVRGKDCRARSGARIALFCVLVTWIIGGLYFVGHTVPKFDLSRSNVSRTPERVLEMTTKFITMSLGAGVKPPLWPMSGLFALAAVGFGFACMIGSLRLRGEARIRAMGVSWVLLTCVGVALAAGWGRATFETDYLFNSRYVAGAVPIMLAVYCVCETSALRGIKSGGRVALLLLVTSFFMNNLRNGFDLAEAQHQEAVAYESDLHAGMPIPELISRHAPITYYYHGEFEHYLHLLRSAGIGDYASLPVDPVFESRQLTIPLEMHEVNWNAANGAGHVTGTDGYLAFDLGAPLKVSAIRLRYSNRNPQGINPFFVVEWRLQQTQKFDWHTRSYKHLMLPCDGTEVEIPIYLYTMMDQIRIRPDKRPGDFTLRSINILTLPTSATATTRPAGDSR